jgi:hypothetical protein
MTVAELNAANAAYQKLLDLQAYRATLDSNPVSLPAAINSSLPDLADRMQSGTLTAVQDAIDAARQFYGL